MFDNPQEELRRLESRLLEEEEVREEPEVSEELVEVVEVDTLEPEDWLEDARHLLEEEAVVDDREDLGRTRVYPGFNPEEPRIRNFANGYGKIQNRDRADLDLEEYSDQVYKAPREEGLRGLVILACLETLGIVAVVAYWFLVLL